MVLILDGNLEYVAQWPGQYPLPPLSGRATKKNNLFFGFPKAGYKMSSSMPLSQQTLEPYLDTY